MDRDTYSLLDAAATDYVPLELLTLQYKVTIVWNKPWHGMDEERLLHALHTSFIEGDLVAITGEQASAPRWDRFVDARRDLEEGEITATTRDLAGRYLASQAYDGIEIVAGSEQWQELTPWPATYWKSLKIGYKVCFRYQEQTREGREPKPAWVEDLLAETDGWYTSIWRGLP